MTYAALGLLWRYAFTVVLSKVIRVNAPIRLVLRCNIVWLGALVVLSIVYLFSYWYVNLFSYWYLTVRNYLPSHIVLQFFLHLRLLTFICNFCSVFIFQFMPICASDGSLGAGASISTGSTRDFWADPPFLGRISAREYGVYLKSRRILTKAMNRHSDSIWYARFWSNESSAVRPERRVEGIQVIVERQSVVLFRVLSTHLYVMFWSGETGEGNWAACVVCDE